MNIAFTAHMCEIHCGYGFHNSHFDRNIGHFDRHIISGDEISRKHYPKWNVCACPWTNKQVCHEQRKNICFITNSICILMIFISIFHFDFSVFGFVQLTVAVEWILLNPYDRKYLSLKTASAYIFSTNNRK